MSTSPFVIEESNLSVAWTVALDKIVKSRGNEITPLLLTLTNFNESIKTREVLDSSLQKDDFGSIQTVSETIFPNSIYHLYEQDRFAFYKQYLDNLPRMKAIEKSNRRGTYFERLIAYDGRDKKINQLEIIISSIKSKSVKRRSKLQASIFDPDVDHTKGAFQGFPCLQHISFCVSENRGLVLNSFYAIQYLYRRAYGNWLGLINLGKFIANEVQLNFERFNCYIGVEKLDKLTKPQAKNLLKEIN